MKRAAIISALSLSLAAGPAPQAMADGGDAIAGFIVGLGVAAVASGAQKKKSSTRSSKGTSRARRGDAQVQAALNFYNFDAGTPDGLFGPQTRAAIGRYQTALGEPATGEITPAQTSALLTAYARDARVGYGATGAPGPFSPGVVPAAPMTALMASLGSQPAAQPAVIPSAMPLPGSPALATNGSAAALCDTGPAQTAPGFAAASPVETIVSSYCSARGYALTHSVELTKAVPAFDASVSAGQCTAWLDANRLAMTTALGAEPEVAVTQIKALFPGVAAAQSATLADSFAICHGISEAAENPADARAFAGLVAALGSVGYGELVAGSAALGLGTPQSPEAAKSWYLWTAEALDGGGTPLIAVADYDHVPLLVALSDSALEVKTDWQGYLASRNASATQAATPAAVTGGLALPGLPAATAATALPANFQEIYRMTPDQALSACRAGGAAMADLGRATCRAVGAAFNDAGLIAQYQ